MNNLFKEKDLEKRCGGCGAEHQTEWKSQWDEHAPFIHYKTFNCEECGYEIIVRTKHDTSGI
ncbi:hypothetical protein HQ533_01770 [Candidatus Woesearchaeota archaeon]|nr:hypothetical protein [Candidatus Woesearchaeota archaeon]